MEIRSGKPIDIARFKRSWLDVTSLSKLRKEYDRFGRYVSKSSQRMSVRRCEICGSGAYEKISRIHHIDYRRCRACGFVYAALRLKPAALEAYYRRNKGYASRNYANRETYFYRLKNVALPKVDFVARFAKNRRRRWLDVGSGVGDIVAAAKKNGFDAKGLEINEHSIRFGKAMFGIDLVNDTLEGLLRKEGKGSYDVVSFFGVIEHMPDPRSRVRAAQRLLAPGGLLVLEVPNAESLSTLSDFHFPDQVVRHMLPSHHIAVYTGKSLKRLIAPFGFKPVGAWCFGLDFYNWLLHLTMADKKLSGSPLHRFFIENNNEFQKAVDNRQMGDSLLWVARKTR